MRIEVDASRWAKINGIMENLKHQRLQVDEERSQEEVPIFRRPLKQQDVGKYNKSQTLYTR